MPAAATHTPPRVSKIPPCSETAPFSLDWLRRGFAAFLWSSSRSLASLHLRGARALAEIRDSPRGVSEGARFQLAGSFVQYLFERQGMERLRRFLGRAGEVGMDAAARVAFGKTLAELQEEWKSMLGGLER